MRGVVLGREAGDDAKFSVSSFLFPSEVSQWGRGVGGN
jgi:hypothetical protein